VFQIRSSLSGWRYLLLIKYLPALITTASLGTTGALLTSLLGLYMWVDKRRDRKAGRKVDARDIPKQR
jgi:hypothetical protein